MAKAQKGDLIRLKDDSWLVRNGYAERGGIYEVVLECYDGSGVGLKGVIDEDSYTLHHEYEIHRKAGEEDDALAYYQSEVVGSEPDRIVEADAVNSPNHYTQGRFETIEIIEEITQGYSDGYVAYCVGNALKYLARAPFKHGEPTEDIGKAAKYIEFALARLQTQK